MGFLDKAMAAAEQAAMKAKGTAEELQTRRELGQAYGDLGRKAFDLVEAGSLSAPELDPLVGRVRTLKTELEERQAADETAAAGATDRPETADEEHSATPS
jgi:hypothetical protein